MFIGLDGLYAARAQYVNQICGVTHQTFVGTRSTPSPPQLGMFNGLLLPGPVRPGSVFG